MAEFILYVRDQQASRRFYAKVLDRAPRLDVPGMTEFELGGESILGLMPEAGLRRLLGSALPDPATAQGVPRAELYLRVGDANALWQRAVAAGARPLSGLEPRDWGEVVGYCLDPDGHVLAFAHVLAGPRIETDLPIADGFRVSDYRPADGPALVAHLADRAIYERTLAIPYPYRDSDAARWLDRIAEQAESGGRAWNWAIRDASGQLVGAIGLVSAAYGQSHRAEVGYWLARAWWNRGIATAAVRSVVALGFAELGLACVTAHVFASNLASARVLEKAGFAREGLLRAHYQKDGRLEDALVYSVVSAQGHASVVESGATTTGVAPSANDWRKHR